MVSVTINGKIDRGVIYHILSASIHAVLAMATAEDMELHQINIKGAYLNGELTE
jgi:hypothetical protein